jgi:hypothetical protein
MPSGENLKKRTRKSEETVMKKEYKRTTENKYLRQKRYLRSKLMNRRRWEKGYLKRGGRNGEAYIKDTN